MDYIKAFLVGGGICAVGQLLIDYTKLTPARILTGFVVAGVFLGAAGIWGPLAEFAGAGATVPIVGFGNMLWEGVKTAVEQRGILGLLTGPLTTEREADAFWTLSATPLLGSFFSVPATLHKSTREKNTPQSWEMKPSYLGGKSP